MFFKLSKNSAPERILVFSLTNIGDVVLTCPVIDILRESFPLARMDVMTGPKASSLFEDNPYFGIKVFDKHATMRKKQAWFSELRAQRYDCVVDLRRTMLPVFLMPKYATPVASFHSFKGHKRQAHLNHLRRVYHFDRQASQRYAVFTTGEDERFFARNVEPFLEGRKFAVIAAGTASGEKRWHAQGFMAVADYLSESTRVVFVGDTKDRQFIEYIRAGMKNPSLSLAGRINLRQAAYVLKRCSWALTHDSGIMHLASYLDVPLVALWGPSPLEKYAPWSAKYVVVRRNEQCARCQDPKAKPEHSCMSFIGPDDVINAIKELRDENH
ncbi:MAG: glycosyltransferase family 9 protein [Candidatus Omnitrophica bacterium]|nr:glycosyltransferase family 9 protein [Candidatus Omnitrophota bacterium]MDE2231248.1 glycosyltransferase family 9 protein [Candidatus Omnitrophota bacterium]